MRNLIRRSMVVGIISLTLLVSGCYIDFGSSGGGAAKTVTIDSVGWVYSNVNPAFWATEIPDGTPTPEVLVSFAAGLTETNIALSDIASVTIAAGETNWVRSSGQLNYDAESGVISMPFNYWPSTPYSLPLTGWEMTVELVNGADSTVRLDLPQPGTDTTDSTITHVYNENYGESQANRVEMLRKPEVTDFAKGGSSVFITFRVDDANVYNGWVAFYDSNDDEIGSSPSFANWSDGAPNQAIISSLATDGSSNTVTIEDTEMDLETGKTYADVAKAALIVTDGEQYQSDFVYSFRGISKRFTF